MNERRPRNALYLLPNAITTAALFAGFYAILRAFAGDWQQAAQCVVIAALLDACDGRVARWTHTETAFGVEYDSLSDMVAFGAAPAIMFYQWGLSELGNIGLGIAFCYCAATACRLARFNTQVGTVDRRYFIGIPSPAAALFAVSYVATASDKTFGWPAAATSVVCLFLSFSMISGVRFYSFKGLDVKSRFSFRSGVFLLVFGAMLVNAVISYDLMLSLFVLMGTYLLSGYVYALWGWWKRQPPPSNKTD